MVSALALRAMARSQWALVRQFYLLRRFQTKCALLIIQEPRHHERIGLMLPIGRADSMRGKFGHGGHDPRQIDLIAAFALLIVIVAACRFLSGSTEAPTATAFIVPSQSVRW